MEKWRTVTKKLLVFVTKEVTVAFISSRDQEWCKIGGEGRKTWPPSIW
jgi:hypothetical protein